MRKLLDEKYIIFKMSNITLKESNKLFSKAESGSPGACEQSVGNNRSPGISGVQKRRNKYEEKQQGSIDNNRSSKESVNKSENKVKSKSKNKNIHREQDTICNCNLPDYVLYNQNYGGIHMHRQQMFYSNFIKNGVNVSPCFVANGFYRSLSETAVPYQQLSNVYFNSYENYNGVPGVSTNKASSCTSNMNSIRSWQFTSLGKILHKLNGGKNPGITFKVMTYNVLAQDLLLEHPELYRDNDKATLEWAIRWHNIYRDIKEHDCEIICLQEVQENHLGRYFNTLEELGYRGIYKQRTGIRSDGCAIYYKSNLFNLVEYITVEYRQPNVAILDRDNVGIIATFAPKDNPIAEFVIATTHLLYNPRRNDVRLAQVQVLFAEIERMAYRSSDSTSNYVPVILTGDLNSEPKTPVYDFIANSKLKYENIALRSCNTIGKTLIPPWLLITDSCQHAGLLKFRASKQKLVRKDEQKFIQLTEDGRRNTSLKSNAEYMKYKFSSGTLTHNFAFKSAYKHTVNNDTEGTTYQNAWVTVDYIFYSGILASDRNVKDDKLKLLSRFILPTTRQLTNVKIPNTEEGSDHLALLAYFKLEY